jgi:hypothetical protein
MGVLVCRDAHLIRAGADGRLMLGNSPFRNRKLSVAEKNAENFLYITNFTENK